MFTNKRIVIVVSNYPCYGLFWNKVSSRKKSTTLANWCKRRCVNFTLYMNIEFAYSDDVTFTWKETFYYVFIFLYTKFRELLYLLREIKGFYFLFSINSVCRKKILIFLNSEKNIQILRFKKQPCILEVMY